MYIEKGNFIYDKISTLEAIYNFVTMNEALLRIISYLHYNLLISSSLSSGVVSLSTNNLCATNNFSFSLWIQCLCLTMDRVGERRGSES